MIEVINVTKKFGAAEGNFNISFSVKEGETYAIVGPNGSGKSTLLSQILGLLKSDSGEVWLNDFQTWQSRERIMEFTGFLQTDFIMYPNWTGLQYLKLIARLKYQTDWHFVTLLIDHFKIDVSTKIKKMSKGMKQKIAIIAAVLNKPRVVIFDEPTSGLDPVMQQQFSKLLDKLKQICNITTVICTHVYQDVVDLADRVGILKEGYLINEVEINKNDKQKSISTIKKLIKEKRDYL